MSISAVDSSIFSSSSLGFSQMNGSSKSSGSDSDEIAKSIVENDDTDGDGLLSFSETQLDEDRFDAIDTDGDGFISAEELSADAQSNMEQQGLMGQISMQMQGVDTTQMAASIISSDDADGDGVLSLSETPLDEDTFNSIDTDGDGYITSDELSTDMENNAAQGAAGPPAGSESQVAAASGSSEDSEEDYDAYDLNEDGVVSVDELLQAFRNGESSLGSLLEGMGEGVASVLTQRYAMEAYQAQMA